LLFALLARTTTAGGPPQGSIVGWGRQFVGVDLSQGFVQVSAGESYSLGLKADGSIVLWGEGPKNIPLPNANFIAIAAAAEHALGLRADGSIAGWGSNRNGQTSVPLPNADFVAVAVGLQHSLGLKADGSIVAWGCGYTAGDFGQCQVPTPNAD